MESKYAGPVNKRRVYRRRAATPVSRNAVQRKPYYRRKYQLFRNPLPAWPNTCKMSFTYNTGNIVTTSNSVNDGVLQTYRLNGCWDPDAAIGGDNVYGFDQFLGTLYDRFYCYATDVTITASSGSVNDVVYVGFLVRQTGSTSITSIPLLINQPGQMWRLVGGGNAPVTMHRRVVHKDLLGLTNIESLCGSSTSDPTDIVFGSVWVAHSNYAIAPNAVPVAVALRLKFHCILGRKDIVPTSI